MTALAWSAAPVPPGKAAHAEFVTWRKAHASGNEEWAEIVNRYRTRLAAAGDAPASVERKIRAIEAYDEGEFYDRIYASASGLPAAPNALLAAALRGRPRGKALDVAMGQGRNALFMASQGWSVTGFDVSTRGLDRARRAARARRLRIQAIHACDEDFDFGREQWDLIALIYPIEKRSVLRVREALRPGGIVVMEVAHKSASGARFEYESGELMEIFDGFLWLRYEEVTTLPDWGAEKGPAKLIRLVAEKPGGADHRGARRPGQTNPVRPLRPAGGRAAIEEAAPGPASLWCASASQATARHRNGMYSIRPPTHGPPSPPQSMTHAEHAVSWDTITRPCVVERSSKSSSSPTLGLLVQHNFDNFDLRAGDPCHSARIDLDLRSEGRGHDPSIVTALKQIVTPPTPTPCPPRAPFNP
ncbi:MAG: class I SAM-dependent methyltransferase [Bryobacteraceae bacterium]